jgi:hypothetical protein
MFVCLCFFLLSICMLTSSLQFVEDDGDGDSNKLDLPSNFQVGWKSFFFFLL